MLSTYASRTIHILLMTFWLLLHRKKQQHSRPLVDLPIIALGQIVASLLSLCMTKWLHKWRRGWRYVRSNAKNAKSLLFRVLQKIIVSLWFGTLCATATWVSFKIALLWLIQQWSHFVFFCHLRCRAVQPVKSQTHFYLTNRTRQLLIWNWSIDMI